MSGRSIPIALQTHLKQSSTTTCRLWKVMAYGVTPFGLSSLDRDVVYDGVTYKAHRGYTPYSIQADADLSVDNSEMEVLIATYEVDGFTLDAIQRGVYDDATFYEYMVNYDDLSDGALVMSSGTVGKIRQIDGMVCFPESRSLTQTLKQKAIIEKGSVGCRVLAFGDERCKYNVAAEWTSGDVDSVGAESDRTFTIVGSGVMEVNDYYAPGVYEFETGDNAGRTYEIESYEVTSAGPEITLMIPTEKPIQIGDTGKIRRDCSRQWEGHNSCDTYNNRPNYRGEPFRPVAETAALMAPGAGTKDGPSDVQTSIE